MRIDQYTPERIAMLRSAFNLVCDRTHWKNPIDALVTENDLREIGSLLPVSDPASEPDSLLIEAVIFFTGSVPRITRCQIEVPVRHRDGLVTMMFQQPGYRVEAAGYYAAIGA